MNLIIYTPETLPAAKPKGNPFLHVNTNGNVTFSRPACEVLGLKPGSRIRFAQDKDKPKDWYLLPGDKSGFQVRGKRTEGDNLTFTSIHLVRLLWESYNLPVGNARIPIVAVPQLVNGQKVYTLLTGALKKLELEKDPLLKKSA